MKKRTFVCFLIFTLCVFHSSLPGTAFAQDASLAEQVLEKYSADTGTGGHSSGSSRCFGGA